MVDEGWLVTQLSSEGLLPPERLEVARQRQSHQGGDLVQNLWETGAVEESPLLRAISIAHRTSYVTIEKLSKVRVARDVIERVPEEVAASQRLVPLTFDAASQTLTVVAADPTQAAIEVARRVSMAAQVRAYVALPQAVDAAIRRFYHDDPAAFTPLDRHRKLDGASTLPGAAPAPTRGTHPTQGPMTPSSGVPAPISAVRSAPTRPPAATHRGFAGARRTSPPFEDEFSGLDITKRTSPPPPSGLDSTTRPTRDLHQGAITSELRLHAGEAPALSMAAYLETLKVLVSVTEMGPVSWRQGHAAEVTRLAARLAKRIGLPVREQAELSIAAYLHDVGKPDDPHLTLLGLSMVPDQRAIAERVVSTPLRLFEGAQLPEAALATLGALYERVDGQGLPRQRRARDIPLGARILALCDAYVDLTTNPYGAAGGNIWERGAALNALKRQKDVLFDGHLVDILAQLVSGEDLRQRLLGERPRILLVDADAESTSMFELKLVANGDEVRVARSAAEALRAMTTWTPDLVVSEVTLEGGGGFTLLEEARKQKRTAEIPFVFLTDKSSAADLERGFALGAADYLTKPVPLDVLLVKVRRLVIERLRAREVDSGPGRRVAGSLAEMSVADVIEVLAKGKKSGALRLQAPSPQSMRGEVWLDTGKIVHAAVPPDIAGQEALYRMLAMREGDFTFVAGAAAPTRSIDAATEWLLLEAMRRIDEHGSGR